MHRVLIVIAAGIALSGSLFVASAQKTTPLGTGGGGSPHVRTTWTIDGASVSIEYGQPYLKGRAEAMMMPPGTPWRTGADEATVITSDKPLKFGLVSLPAGRFTINTQPGAEWQLILGRLEKPGQWGIPYNAKLELGRMPMKTGKTAKPVEQVTISIDDTPAGANLRIEWGTTSAVAPFTIGG
jgi:hypothetical protein